MQLGLAVDVPSGVDGGTGTTWEPFRLQKLGVANTLFIPFHGSSFTQFPSTPFFRLALQSQLECLRQLHWALRAGRGSTPAWHAMFVLGKWPLTTHLLSVCPVHSWHWRAAPQAEVVSPGLLHSPRGYVAKGLLLCLPESPGLPCTCFSSVAVALTAQQLFNEEGSLLFRTLFLWAWGHFLCHIQLTFSLHFIANINV